MWKTIDTIAMVTLLLLLGALVATGAEAQTTCTTNGPFTTCTGQSGRTVNCTTLGPFTTCQ